MEDSMGNTIKVLDQVLIVRPEFRELALGVISKITKKRVWVEYIPQGGTSPRKCTRTPKQIALYSKKD